MRRCIFFFTIFSKNFEIRISTSSVYNIYLKNYASRPLRWATMQLFSPCQDHQKILGFYSLCSGLNRPNLLDSMTAGQLRANENGRGLIMSLRAQTNPAHNILLILYLIYNNPLLPHSILKIRQWFYLYQVIFQPHKIHKIQQK